MPERGKESLAAGAIVQAFQKAVQARRLYGAPSGAARFADTFESALVAYLDQHAVLPLAVTPHGFYFRGTRALPEERRDVPAFLADAGLVELIFLRGTTRAEIDRLVEVVQAAAELQEGDASLLTLLWDAGFEHVRFRGADELPGAAAPDLDCNVSNLATVEHPELAPLLRGLDTPTCTGPGLPAPVLDERSELQDPRTAVARLGAALVDIQLRETDVARRGAALVLLGDLVDALVARRRIAPVQALVTHVRSRLAAQPELQSVHAHLLECLCQDANVMALGEVLDDSEGDGGEIAAARALLQDLPGAVPPLCTLLGRLENMQARKLVCHVLATVATGDPGLLAHQAAGQPWFVVRNVAYVMGRIATAGVVPHLRRWATHEDVRVRSEVARSLGRVQHASAASLLCEMLRDDAPRVRQCAVWSLATLGDVVALPRLRALIFEDRGFRSRPNDERDDCFRTYGRLADSVAFEELVRVLEQRALVSVGWPSELRRGAALALGETGRPEAARLLQQHAAGRDARLREACAAGLEALRNQGTSPPEDGGTWHPARKARGAAREGAQFRLEVDDAG